MCVHGSVSIKLYLQNRGVGQMWPMGYGLLTVASELLVTTGEGNWERSPGGLS